MFTENDIKENCSIETNVQRYVIMIGQNNSHQTILQFITSLLYYVVSPQTSMELRVIAIQKADILDSHENHMNRNWKLQETGRKNSFFSSFKVGLCELRLSHVPRQQNFASSLYLQTRISNSFHAEIHNSFYSEWRNVCSSFICFAKISVVSFTSVQVIASINFTKLFDYSACQK